MLRLLFDGPRRCRRRRCGNVYGISTRFVNAFVENRNYEQTLCAVHLKYRIELRMGMSADLWFVWWLSVACSGFGVQLIILLTSSVHICHKCGTQYIIYIRTWYVLYTRIHITWECNHSLMNCRCVCVFAIGSSSYLSAGAINYRTLSCGHMCSLCTQAHNRSAVGRMPFCENRIRGTRGNITQTPPKKRRRYIGLFSPERSKERRWATQKQNLPYFTIENQVSVDRHF